MLLQSPSTLHCTVTLINCLELRTSHVVVMEAKQFLITDADKSHSSKTKKKYKQGKHNTQGLNYLDVPNSKAIGQKWQNIQNKLKGI